MIKKNRRNLLVLIGTSLSIGCTFSVLENLASGAMDSILPDVKGLAEIRRPGTITLLSSNGKIIQKQGPVTRERIGDQTIPIILKKAFIASEDRRFYKHNGVDIWGISRALIKNLIKGSVEEGGSTITQQLARTIFLSQDRTLARKVKEAALAYKIERQLSKDKILEQYLDNVYLGSGAYGVADAAWIYFSKKPEVLSLSEAALIAGLPPAPSLYSPLVNPRKALKRRSIVLNRMQMAGFIDPLEAKAANQEPLNLKPAVPKYYNSAAPFFTSWVEKEIPKVLTKEQIELGGLKIVTSLNLDWQKKAEKAIRNYSPGETEGSLVSIEPNTGLIKVMVGGKNFRDTQFNRATQALRSPGSTFKLFPYLAALRYGLIPEDKIIDTPICWYGYCPKNFSNKYMGEVTLSDSLKHSLNTVSVQLLAKVGFKNVIDIANKLGIGNKRKLGRYYPLAIGAYEQTLLEMTSAYAAITNRGIFIKPMAFQEIRGPNNNILWSLKKHGNKGNRAVSQDIADTMNWMLQEVVRSGTGIAATLKNRPVAGKTGTSEGGRDLWFIGSIPQLTTGVWFGHDDNRETKSGSGEAAWVWKKFMSEIESNLQIINFPRKPSKYINRDPKSGILITPGKGPKPSLGNRN